MKESVRETKHPWASGIALAAIAGAYFFFLGTSKFREPGADLQYNIKQYEDIDDIETRWEEVDEIALDLDTPRGMAVLGERLFVAGTNAVSELDARHNEVVRHAFEGEPNCLAVAPDGTMFVAMPNEVQVLNADGSEGDRWTDFSERSYLTSIVATEEDVFIADAGKHVVYRYNWDGERKKEIGRRDDEKDVPGIEVPSPYLDLALNDEGHLWVVNPGKLGLERYRTNGEFVTSWYHPTLELHGFSGCCNPTQIAFDQSGNLVTGEKGLVRLKKYEVTAGDFQELIVGHKSFPKVKSVPKEKSMRDLVVDSEDRILALDPRTDTIRIFAMKETADGAETT
jgi:hypothetical protein